MHIQSYSASLCSGVLKCNMYVFQVHDERELDRVLKINGVQLIGINNRNLGTVYNICCITA
jgi:indole-3-glycerol phosphate synthase